MKTTNDKPLLSEDTKRQTASFLNNPAHALLIVGEPASGKSRLAHYLAAAVLGVSEEKLANHPYCFFVRKDEDKQDISIDAVRQVIRSLSLKVPASSKKVNRVIVVEDAHFLSREAQNALLKTLEEPPKATIFIMSSSSEHDLLPTIISRAQIIQMTPTSLELAKGYFQDRYSEQEIMSAWHLSQGTAGMIEALLEAADHPLKVMVDRAKNFLKSGVYERILALDSFAGSKPELELFLDALSRLLGVLHHEAIKKKNVTQAGRLLQSRKQLSEAQKKLKSNASARLICLDLALSLSV